MSSLLFLPSAFFPPLFRTHFGADVILEQAFYSPITNLVYIRYVPGKVHVKYVEAMLTSALHKGEKNMVR